LFSFLYRIFYWKTKKTLEEYPNIPLFFDVTLSFEIYFSHFHIIFVFFLFDIDLLLIWLMKNDIYYINWHFEMCHRAKVNKKVNASKKGDSKALNKYLLKLITLAAVRKLKKKFKQETHFSKI